MKTQSNEKLADVAALVIELRQEAKHRTEIFNDPDLEISRLLNTAADYIERAKADLADGEGDDFHKLCAQCWDALGITEYTGKHIVEHIRELREKATPQANKDHIGEVNKMVEAQANKALEAFLDIFECYASPEYADYEKFLVVLEALKESK